MEDIIRYLFVGFGIGVLFMAAILWFFVFRQFEKDIEKRKERSKDDN